MKYKCQVCGCEIECEYIEEKYAQCPNCGEIGTVER